MAVQISGDGGITGAVVSAAGAVLNVVSVVKTDTFTTASTSFVDLTGLVATITPRSTASKILVMVRLGKASGGGNGSGACRLTRNGSAIALGDAAGTRIQASFALGPADSASNHGASEGFEYLDTPAAITPLTYQVQIATQGGLSVYVNRSGSGDADGSEMYRARTVSTITLMEVGGG